MSSISVCIYICIYSPPKKKSNNVNNIPFPYGDITENILDSVYYYKNII